MRSGLLVRAVLLVRAGPPCGPGLRRAGPGRRDCGRKGLPGRPFPSTIALRDAGSPALSGAAGSPALRDAAGSPALSGAAGSPARTGLAARAGSPARAGLPAGPCWAGMGQVAGPARDRGRRGDNYRALAQFGPAGFSRLRSAGWVRPAGFVRPASCRRLAATWASSVTLIMGRVTYHVSGARGVRFVWVFMHRLRDRSAPPLLWQRQQSVSRSREAMCRATPLTPATPAAGVPDRGTRARPGSIAGGNGRRGAAICDQRALPRRNARFRAAQPGAQPGRPSRAAQPGRPSLEPSLGGPARAAQPGGPARPPGERFMAG